MKNEDKILEEFNKNKNSILDLEMVSGRRKDNKKVKNINQSKQNNNISMGKNIVIRKPTSLSASFDSTTSYLDIKNKRNSFYDKQLLRLQQKNFKIEMLRNNIREQEKRKMKDKPELSKYTQIILLNKSIGDKPFYHRTQEVLERKHNRIENLKRLYTEIDRIEENEKNYSNLNTSNNNIQSQGNLNKWLNHLALWQRNKEDKIERIKLDMRILDTEAENEYYRPTINKTSEILARMKTQSDASNINKNLHERLYDEYGEMELKHNRLVEELSPPFFPTTNHKKPAYLINSNVKFLKKQINSVITNRNQGNLNEQNTKIKNKRNKNKIKEMNHSAITSSRNITENNYKEKSLHIMNNQTKLNKNQSLTPDNSQTSKRWQDAIHNINNNKTKKDDIDTLYRLNIRSASAWDQDKENCIYMNPRMSFIKNILK